MTVTTTATRISYAGTGTTGPFDIPFKIFTDGDVVVTKTVDATGVSTTLTLTTDYSITGAGDSGADLTTVAAVETGETLLIYLELDITQPTDFVNNDGFDAEVAENAWDRNCLMIKQINESSFAIKTPSSDAAAPAILPAAGLRANKALVFDSNGDPTTGVATSTLPFKTIGQYSNSLTGAISSIGATETTLVIDKEITLTADDTVPSTIHLVFTRDGSLTGAYTTTINGTLEAGEWQIFDSTVTAVVLGSLVQDALPEWWGVDGTADEVQINKAIQALTSGTVWLNTTSYATAATIVWKNGVNIKGVGEALRGAKVTYSGTGNAIFGATIGYTRLSNFQLVCSDDAANGVVLGTGSRRCVIDNVYIEGSGTATNTGAAFLLDAVSGSVFSGGLGIVNCYGIGFKYGIKMVGHGTSDTWTTVDCTNTWLVGRAAGVVTGSAGVYMDADTNGIGSYFRGGTIEAFANGLEHIDGGFGMSLECDMEGNTANYTLGDSYNGEIVIHPKNEIRRSGTNGSTNVWWGEEIKTGNWLTESYFSRRHNLYDASSAAAEWGVTRGASEIGGGSPTDKFIVSTGAAADSASTLNYVKYLTHKVAWDTRAPTGGAWNRGDICYNGDIYGATHAASLGIAYWICTTAGTPGTWTAQHFETHASKSWTPGSIGAAATVTTTVTLPSVGAVAGDFVAVAPPGDLPDGLILQAIITGAATATLKITNITAGALTGTAGTYKVRFWMG